jgi:hypothetical protein
VIMQVSPCQPRSSIFATATAMPALIFSASETERQGGVREVDRFGLLADKQDAGHRVSPLR